MTRSWVWVGPESMEVATTEDVDVFDYGFENVDGAFAAHKGRLHLKGSIKVVAPSPPDDTTVYMTPENQPKRSSEPLVVGESGLSQKLPPKVRLYLQHGSNLAGDIANPLIDVGAQNPSAAGNNGCGYFTNVSFHRGFGGIVTRGQTPDVMSGLNPRDETVPYIGCSGDPVNTLPDVARWYGTLYIFRFLYNPDELTHFEDIFSDVTFIDDHDPADDICFIAGLDSAGDYLHITKSSFQ